jgi:tRNA(Ile)-lysidine synthase
MAAEASGDRDAFLARMGDFIRRHELLPGGARVVAAVSGGADSVALAAALRRAGQWDLHVAHVHHGLRPEADTDAEFVAELARGWELPFHLERIDTPALARTWGAGMEEAGRRGRYQALSAVAARAGAAAVAAAHHADDQVETILHRIFRGTHLRGLGGMAPQRPMGGGVKLVRPLLWARRREIEEFCRAEGLAWRTDHTNLQTDFTRNFIRHELLPLLRRRLNVKADEAVLRLATAAGEAQTVLEELAGRLFDRTCRRRSSDEVVLRVGPLRSAPRPLAAMALRAALAAIATPQQALTQDRYNDLLALVEGRSPAVDLPGGIRAERRGQGLWLSRRDSGQPQ